MKYEIWTDGSGRGIAGFIVKQDSEVIFKKTHKVDLLRWNDNIEAEIRSIELALLYIQDKLILNEDDKIILFNDCKSIIDKLNGIHKGNKKNETLPVRRKLKIIRNYLRKYDIKLRWIPREKNYLVDRMIRLVKV